MCLDIKIPGDDALATWISDTSFAKKRLILKPQEGIESSRRTVFWHMEARLRRPPPPSSA